MKSKKTKINPINNDDDNCFHYAVTVALNHWNIGKSQQEIAKKKPLLNQYNWREITFPSEGEVWRMFETKNKSITLNVLFAPHINKK